MRAISLIGWRHGPGIQTFPEEAAFNWLPGQGSWLCRQLIATTDVVTRSRER